MKDIKTYPEATRNLLNRTAEAPLLEFEKGIENILEALSWYLAAEYEDHRAAHVARCLSQEMDLKDRASNILEWVLDQTDTSTAKDLVDDFSKKDKRISDLEEQLEKLNGT